MNTHQWQLHQQSQRRRCREARGEWEAEQEPMSRTEFFQFVDVLYDRITNLEEAIHLSPNANLWDTIQQLRAEVKYLDNKLTSFISSKGRTNTDVY